MKKRRRELRKKMTEAEEILWSRIQNKKLAGLRFRRQFSIGHYVLDFYLPSHQIAIEIDGEIHNRTEAREADKIRQEAIEGYNVTFLRFTNYQVFSDIEAVLLSIAATANSMPRRNERNVEKVTANRSLPLPRGG